MEIVVETTLQLLLQLSALTDIIESPQNSLNTFSLHSWILPENLSVNYLHQKIYPLWL